MLIGPLPIIYYHPKSRVEARCIRCGWSDFRDTEPEAKARLLHHLETFHINPPQPPNLTADQMPGR